MASGSLPRSSVTAYATGADMVASRDYRQIADLLTEPSTRTAQASPPSTAAEVETYFTTSNATGYRALRWASGQIEAAVTIGGRYLPEDLQELSEAQVIPTPQGGDGSTTAYMVGRDLLVGLTCDLAFWWLCKRRKPGIKAEDVAGASEALDMLDMMRRGDRIFPIQETQEAALPEVVTTIDGVLIEDSAEPVSLRADRFFGLR